MMETSKLEDWTDLSRKSFSGVDSAKNSLELIKKMMGKIANTLLDRKLQEGFELISPLKIEWIRVTEVLECKNPSEVGSVFVDVRHKATIRKI